MKNQRKQPKRKATSARKAGQPAVASSGTESTEQAGRLAMRVIDRCKRNIQESLEDIATAVPLAERMDSAYALDVVLRDVVASSPVFAEYLSSTPFVTELFTGATMVPQRFAVSERVRLRRGLAARRVFEILSDGSALGTEEIVKQVFKIHGERIQEPTIYRALKRGEAKGLFVQEQGRWSLSPAAKAGSGTEWGAHLLAQQDALEETEDKE